VRLQQIFPRILAAEFEPPKGASKECLDLLRKMLTADASKRINVKEIMRHPWFLKDLPAGLEEMNDQLLHASFPPEIQSVQEIMHILQAAARAPQVPAAFPARTSLDGQS
jgi:serine/threonine-protein kinase SRK2